MFSFGNTIKSRAEGGHVKLKQALQTSTGDLRKEVNVIELILKNERSEYFIAYEEAKARVSRLCNIDALKNLRVFISPHALKLIRKQYDKFVSASFSEPLPPCTQIY